MRRILASVVVMAMTTGLGASSMATANAESDHDISERSTSIGTQIERVEGRLVRQTDGTLALPVDAIPGVDAKTFAFLSESLAETNRMIASGEMMSTKTLEVYPTDATYATMSKWGSKWYTKWWGVEVHVSSYWTSKITGAGTFAGAIKALAQAVGKSPKNPIVIALVAVGVGAILVCRNSHGIELKKAWAGGPAWCNGHNN